MLEICFHTGNYGIFLDNGGGYSDKVIALFYMGKIGLKWPQIES